MPDTADNSEYEFPEYYMYPQAVEYNYDKALTYWLKIEPDKVISDLSSELLSTKGHIKPYIEAWLESTTEKSSVPEDKIVLTQSMQSICNTQPEINYLLDAIYLYEANRQKKNRLMQSNKSFVSADIRLPEGYEECAKDILAWYQKAPIEFLSIIVPIVLEKAISSHTIMKAIREEPDIDKIILSKKILSNDEKVVLTFGVIARGLFRTYSILKEELFLLSSYAQNYEKDKTM